MSAIVRDLLPFPPGDNISDTFISGTHWNLTTLHHWNYTYYSNETFSNGSRCYLVFEPYIPVLLQNGSFVNSTTCYSPILPIGSRGSIGLFFASLFFLSVGLTVANLGKHAKLSLPAEKRFLPAGRKWQWCWMLVVAAFALISSIFSVDIDRYYLPALPLIVSSIFWVLMLPTTLAIVLESVRHWGSWQERQLVDLDPFQLSQDDRRSRVELWIPFAFYVCFLMVRLPLPFACISHNDQRRTFLWRFSVLGQTSRINDHQSRFNDTPSHPQLMFASRLRQYPTFLPGLP